MTRKTIFWIPIGIVCVAAITIATFELGLFAARQNDSESNRRFATFQEAMTFIAAEAEKNHTETDDEAMREIAAMSKVDRAHMEPMLIQIRKAKSMTELDDLFLFFGKPENRLKPSAIRRALFQKSYLMAVQNRDFVAIAEWGWDNLLTPNERTANNVEDWLNNMRVYCHSQETAKSMLKALAPNGKPSEELIAFYKEVFDGARLPPHWPTK